jgi:hypothetical protein
MARGSSGPGGTLDVQARELSGLAHESVAIFRLVSSGHGILVRKLRNQDPTCRGT